MVIFLTNDSLNTTYVIGDSYEQNRINRNIHMDISIDSIQFVTIEISTWISICIRIKTKGKQPIQDQSSVLGADILNNPRNYYYGRSSNYPQRIQLSPKHQSGEFRWG